MLLDSGHLMTGKASRRMKVFAFSIHEKVYAALKIVAGRKGLSMSHVARGWLQSVVTHYKKKTIDVSAFRTACENILEGHTIHLSLPLNNELIRELNLIKDKLGIKASGLVNTAIVLGLKQYAQHYAEPELRAEIERALFGDRSAAEVLESKEGNYVAA